MGFFASGSGAKKDGLPSLELLHRLQCKACPLDKVANRNPHIQPRGSKAPLIYILGEAPGAQEDAENKHFVGKSGQLLRARLPEAVLPHLRWSNVVRTRPPNNREPEPIEVECCRPSVSKDIAESKPRAIFGFGKIVLQWAIGQSGIDKWRGKRTPVEIDGHACWFYPMLHPASLLHKGRRASKHRELAPDEIGSEEERAFVFDLKRALDEVEELPEPRIWTKADAEADLELLTNLDQIESALNWAAMQNVVGVDYETFRQRPYASDAQILTAAIGTERRSFAFPFDHPGQKWSPRQRQRLDELWKRFLLSKVRKAVHFLAYEQEWSAVFYGSEVLDNWEGWEDTYNQAATLDDQIGRSGDDGGYRRGGASLDFLVRQHFGFDLKALSLLNKQDLRQEPLMDVLRYNGMDAKCHCLLWQAQDRALSAQNLQGPYRSNLRDVPTLTLTSIKGVPIDQGEVQKIEIKYQDRIEAAETEIMAYEATRVFKSYFKAEYRPSSNADTLKLLTDVMGFHKELEDDRGRVSVDEDALARIDHPIAKALISYRKASKVLSTYIQPYLVDHERSCIWPDGLIHPTINSFGTISNRTSSEGPNIQNDPKRDAETKEVRRRVQASPGHVVVPIDYGQIQPRGIGMHSKDKFLCKALWERYDIHMEWAERVAHAYPSRVGGKAMIKDKKTMKDFRQNIKTWDLALFFGSTMESSSDTLGVPRDVMGPIYDEFWETFSGVKDWQERLLKHYLKTGTVAHIDGRVNRAPLSQNQIYNLPIQGIERQIVLSAMSRLSERARRENDWYFQPELEVHDDLTFILPEAKLDYYLPELAKEMLKIEFDFINVPLVIEVSAGPNLLEVEGILEASSDGRWEVLGD